MASGLALVDRLDDDAGFDICDGGGLLGDDSRHRLRFLSISLKSLPPPTAVLKLDRRPPTGFFCRADHPCISMAPALGRRPQPYVYLLPFLGQVILFGERLAARKNPCLLSGELGHAQPDSWTGKWSAMSWFLPVSTSSRRAHGVAGIPAVPRAKPLRAPAEARRPWR